MTDNGCTEADNPATSGARSPARERILQSLGDVFYTGGTYLVGMADLVKHLGVTRRTFYRSFESKEALIVAYLEHRHRLVQEHLGSTIAGRTGADAVLAVFENLEEKTQAERFRGCAFLLAASENPQSAKIRAASRTHKDFLKRFFLDLLDETPDRDERAEQLLVLYEGALAGSVLRREARVARAAKAIAAMLLLRRDAPS